MEYLAKKSFSFLQDFAFISKSILKIYIASFIFHWYTFLQKIRLLVLVKFFTNFANM